MKILGLDSSGIVASVAVVQDDVLVAEYTVNYKKTHSQTLLPRSRFFYRAENRFCHSQGTGSCTQETTDRSTYSRRTGL